MRIRISENERASLERPAWTQDNLHAYKNRYTTGYNGINSRILKNYYKQGTRQ